MERIHEEDINIVNIYAPKLGAPKYIRKILEEFKKIEIISNIFSDHKGLKLETNLKEKKTQNTQKHGD